MILLLSPPRPHLRLLRECSVPYTVVSRSTEDSSYLFSPASSASASLRRSPRRSASVVVAKREAESEEPIIIRADSMKPPVTRSRKPYGALDTAPSPKRPRKSVRPVKHWVVFARGLTHLQQSTTPQPAQVPQEPQEVYHPPALSFVPGQADTASLIQALFPSFAGDLSNPLLSIYPDISHLNLSFHRKDLAGSNSSVHSFGSEREPHQKRLALQPEMNVVGQGSTGTGRESMYLDLSFVRPGEPVVFVSTEKVVKQTYKCVYRVGTADINLFVAQNSERHYPNSAVAC